MMDTQSGLITQAIQHFNGGEFRLALLAFEQVWLMQRSDGLRAIIQLCNALHQLQRGLVTAPRHNLASAARLLDTNQPDCAGMDARVLLEYVRSVQACIPASLETGAGSVAWETVPSISI
jgi:hypothetical protein